MAAFGHTAAMEHLLRVGGAGLGLGALTNALGRAGVLGPEGPLSTAQVFAACGGIGFHYAVLGEGAGARVLVDGLAPGVSSRASASLDAAAALGADVRHLSDPLELAPALAAGASVVLWADRASLPYDPMPRGYERSLGMLLGMVGFDAEADEFLVDDRAALPLPVDTARLLLPFTQAPGGPTVAALRAAAPVERLPEVLLQRVVEGLAAHLDGPLGNRGTVGIRSLARRIRDPGHDHGWRRIFGRNLAMFHAHAALYRFVEEGVGPGLGRPLFGDSLAELGVLLGRRDLQRQGDRWREIGAGWTALANAALPDGVESFGAARRTFIHRTALFRRDGLDASRELAAAKEQLGGLAREVGGRFPMESSALALLHGTLADGLVALAQQEEAAGRELLGLCAR